MRMIVISTFSISVLTPRYFTESVSYLFKVLKMAVSIALVFSDSLKSENNLKATTLMKKLKLYSFSFKSFFVF